tara:strand:- start:97 stop:351 length:255 start_codon:yes stop_codon:yes gene_type:complete
MSNYTYVLLDSSEVVNIDFNEVIEASADTLRYSLDGLKTLVKFDGNTPDFLEGKDTLTHAEMREEVSGPNWEVPPDIVPPDIAP